MIKINTKKFNHLISVSKLCLVFFIFTLIPTSAISKNLYHPGQTDFNVKDRLAIINVIKSYADDYDHNKFSEYLKAIAKLKIVAIGFAIPFPAISGAEP